MCVNEEREARAELEPEALWVQGQETRPSRLAACPLRVLGYLPHRGGGLSQEARGVGLAGGGRGPIFSLGHGGAGHAG